MKPNQLGPQRVRDVIVRLAQGQTVGEIALAWGRSNSTVEWYWELAKRAYNLTCYQDAVWCALRKKWLKLNQTARERSGIRT